MILDTNALSAIADGESGAVLKVSSLSHVALPTIVLGEFRFGIGQSRHRLEYERWLGQMLTAYRVLDVTEETATWYAQIRGQLKQAGTPIPSNDAWIAALCRQHSFPLLSRDRHFDNVSGIQRLDW